MKQKSNVWNVFKLNNKTREACMYYFQKVSWASFAVLEQFQFQFQTTTKSTWPTVGFSGDFEQYWTCLGISDSTLNKLDNSYFSKYFW